jgi:hypothetical protein
MFGCNFSNDATSSSHWVRWEAAVVGGSQFTVMEVGALTSAAAELAGAALVAAGALDAAAGVLAATAGLDALGVLAGALEAAALGLLLEQPAKVTTPATASSATNLWCFIERSSWKVGPGRRSPRQSRARSLWTSAAGTPSHLSMGSRVALKVQMPTHVSNRLT